MFVYYCKILNIFFIITVEYYYSEFVRTPIESVDADDSLP